MKKIVFALGILTSALSIHSHVSAHCQMPCGIYHDNMIYDQIDQYVETMFKGITIICNTNLQTPHDKCEVIRWVMLKDKASDDVAHTITSYFLQQKIPVGEAETPKKLVSAHKLLFKLMQIKQNADRKMIEDFADEWDNFKLMFHVEGYACQVELLNQRKRDQLEERKKAQGATAVTAPESHDHDHDHDHDHSH